MERAFTVVLHGNEIETFLLNSAPSPKLMRTVVDANTTLRRRKEDALVMINPTSESYIDVMEPITDEEALRIVENWTWESVWGIIGDEFNGLPTVPALR